jgi:hypothetical protein
MINIRNIIRFSIVGSLFISFFSTLFVSEIQCYMCDTHISLMIIGLHLILLTASLLGHKLIDMLILTLLVFYASRIGILQFDMNYYVYQRDIPTINQMVEILWVLLAISIGLLLGTILGLGTKLRRGSESDILMYAKSIKNKKAYYRYLLYILIASKLVMLYLFLTTGLGVAVNWSYFSIGLLRVAKLARMLGFLSIIPIAWLIIMKPTGYDRKITIIAVALVITDGFIAGSKAALLTAILPFILTYIVSGMRIPRKMLSFMVVLTIFAVLVVYPFMGYLRVYFQALMSGSVASFGNVIPHGLDISKILLSFFSRIGAAFDALSFVVIHKSQFTMYADLQAEFLGVINGYVPGKIISVEIPEWGKILFGLGNNSDIAAAIKAGTGEIITLPGHLTIYFNIIWSSIISLCLMFAVSVMYNQFNNLYARIIIVYTIIMGISNGSGLISFMLFIPMKLLFMYIIYINYKYWSVISKPNLINGKRFTT